MDFAGFIHDAGQPTSHFNVLKELGKDSKRIIVDETAPMYFVGMDETYSPKGWALKNLSLPVHFLSGEDDPCHTGIQNFDAAAAMIAAKGYPTTKKLFPQMRHEILLEKESAMVVDHILNVLKEMAQ